MCHCIFFRINPRVSKYHAFSHHRATCTTRFLVSGAMVWIPYPLDTLPCRYPTPWIPKPRYHTPWIPYPWIPHPPRRNMGPETPGPEGTLTRHTLLLGCPPDTLPLDTLPLHKGHGTRDTLPH